MAKEYENSGIISRNKEKDDEHPNWPDLKGSATVGGDEYWVSGWAKENDRGKYFSLSFQPKDKGKGGGRSSGGSKPDRRQEPPKDDGGIPF
jgi:hypothetical protein